MHTFTVELVGSSPIILQPTELLEDLTQQVVAHFRTAFFSAAKSQKVTDPIQLDINMNIDLINTADRVDQRIGIKEYKDWKLELNIVYDDANLQKEKIFEIIHLASGKKD